MKKIIFLLFCSILFNQTLKAQDVPKKKTIEKSENTILKDGKSKQNKTETEKVELEIESDTFTYVRPKFVLKYSPSALLSITLPCFQFSLEYPIGKSNMFFLEHDIGLVFDDTNRGNVTSQTFGGRLGTRVRAYLPPLDKANVHFFLSGMGRYSFGVAKGFDFFDRAGGAYQEELNFTRTRHFYEVFGESGLMGFFDAEKRFMFEFYGGFGLCFFRENFKDIPQDANFIDRAGGFINILDTENALPTFAFVFKVGYVFQ